MKPCRYCEKGQVFYTGQGYCFKCGNCGITAAYPQYYDIELSQEEPKQTTAKPD